MMKFFQHDETVDTAKKLETGLQPRDLVEPEPPARPDVYPGNMPVGRPLETAPIYPGPRNRKIVRRRTSPFSIILILLGTAVAIVLYISNIIAVNQLLGEINSLRSQYERISMEQEILRAQINRMASLDRIQEKAQSDLGLKNPAESPVWLQIDQQKVKEIEEARKEP